MRNILFSVLVLFVACVVHAQDIQRVQIDGIVKVPGGEDIEGISVYNASSQKGTITNEEGKFNIAVAENDRLTFTALQFQEFTVIIDQGVIDEGVLSVFINPAVVQLDEVIVRPYDLSGNVRVDAGKIQYVDVEIPMMDLSYKNLEYNSDFAPDSQTSIPQNVSLEALGYTQQREGANVFGLVDLLFGRKTTKPTRRELVQLKDAKITAIQQRFGNQYFEDTLQIPEERIGEFLYYAEDEGLSTDLLKAENELKLMDYLERKSKVFLELSED